METNRYNTFIPWRDLSWRDRIAFYGSLALVTMMAACGSSGASSANTNPVTGNNPTVPPTPHAGKCVEPTNPAGIHTFGIFQFNFMGGGSKVILVYPGVCDTDTAKAYDAQYLDKEKVPAICEATGRTVTRDAELGETPGSSNKWVELQFTTGSSQGSGEREFATLAYGEVVSGQLPPCDQPGQSAEVEQAAVAEPPRSIWRQMLGRMSLAA